MCVSCDQYIHPHLPLQYGQSLLITPGNNLMSMTQSNLEVTYLCDLCARVSSRHLADCASGICTKTGALKLDHVEYAGGWGALLVAVFRA